jgi:hypothetical protein
LSIFRENLTASTLFHQKECLNRTSPTLQNCCFPFANAGYDFLPSIISIKKAFFSIIYCDHSQNRGKNLAISGSIFAPWAEYHGYCENARKPLERFLPQPA